MIARYWTFGANQRNAGIGIFSRREIVEKETVTDLKRK